MGCLLLICVANAVLFLFLGWPVFFVSRRTRSWKEGGEGRKHQQPWQAECSGTTPRLIRYIMMPVSPGCIEGRPGADPPPLSLLLQGEHARMSSFIGAIAIADLVKTTLGPKGMDKILQSVSAWSGRGPWREGTAAADGCWWWPTWWWWW